MRMSLNYSLIAFMSTSCSLPQVVEQELSNEDYDWVTCRERAGDRVISGLAAGMVGVMVFGG